MNYLKRQNGITMISLVVTIIVLVILSSMVTHTGISSIKNTRFERFKNELEIVQKNVDVWYEQTVEKSTDEIMLGSPITADRKIEFDSLITKVAQIVNNSGDQNSSKTVTVKTDINRYRYFGENEFTDLQIGGIENEYLIDIKSQVAIFIGGYEFEDIKYYMLDQIRDVTRGGSSIGEYIKISSFSIESNIEMTYKDKRTIIADIKPENANEELTWSSSNTEVVDVKGVTESNNMAELTANDQGTALIRVSNKSLTIIKECKTIREEQKCQIQIKTPLHLISPLNRGTSQKQCLCRGTR